MDNVDVEKIYERIVLDKKFYAACLDGRLDTVNFIIENAKLEPYWDGGFCGACKGGHINVVNLIIEKAGATINHVIGLRIACKYDHLDIIELIINHGKINIYTQEPLLPKKYIEYKHAQLLKYTKLHESLITIIKF